MSHGVKRFAKQLFPLTDHRYHTRKEPGETGLSWGTLLLVERQGGEAAWKQGHIGSITGC